MATAKKLPSGSWRVLARRMINGKMVAKSFTDKDIRKAEAAAKAWQAEPDELDDI